MIIYSSLIFICLLFHFFCKRRQNLCFNFTIILLFLVSAFRYNVGTDYKHYQDIFGWILNGNEVYVESGYKFFNIFIQNILRMNVNGLYIISSLIIVGFLGIGIKENVDKKYWFFSLFMLICSGIYFASFNLIRQYIAISILVFGHKLLIKKKYIMYFLLIILATLFHTSAIIVAMFVIFVILFRDKNNYKFLWGIYIISLLFLMLDIRGIFNLLQHFIPARWVWYLNSDFLLEKNYSAIFKQIVPNIIMFFLLINRKKLREKDSANDIYILGYLVYILLTNCFFGVLVLVRLANYFDIYLIFCVPLLIELNIARLDKKIIILLFVIYYIILTIITIFLMNGHGVIPYKTIFAN